MKYHDTLLRYHLGIDPSELTDEEWAEQLAILEDIRTKETKPSR